ncbi:myosin heavy chain, non-muscle-like isoform X3 [Apis dorsata]|uniref:myosin heavy chain, non-muscle-like isoform X3 n=1 Tax=Apis dorsata TaxID=7462 RepID=UPI001293B3A4|nr:myosin heavy chain, non-muscle-like isoform X3 [Apis dorsata]
MGIWNVNFKVMNENEDTINVIEKSAMSSAGIKGASASQKLKNLNNHSGRNSVHGETTSNTTEDASINNKSQTNTVRRPGKSSISPTMHKRPTTNLPAGSTLRPENQYAMKKKRYLLLKKELTDKQKAAQELYTELSQLREKLLTTGARDPGKPEILKLEIGPPKASFPTEQICNEPVDTHIEKLSAGNELLECLEDRLREIPQRLRTICKELLDKQSNFTSFITSHLIEASENTEANPEEVTIQLEVHQRDYDSIRSRLNEIQELEEKSIAELRNNVQNMIDEYEHSRSKLKELNTIEAQKELQVHLNAAMEELQAEKDKNNQGKDRLRQTETHLQKARTKIRDLETSMAADKDKIQQLQCNVKSLEGQMKQKDMAIDARLKDMQKTMKNSEDLVSKVEKQRDSFEARLVELKEKMNSKENESMSTIKEMSERLKAITADLGVEKEKRQQVEDAFVELDERYRNLEEKSKQLCELAEKNKDITITEGNHTENEVRLFNELQQTRNELEAERQTKLQLQQEKEEIIAVMHQAACREEDEDSREKLAAELVFKSNELQKLMMQYTGLKKVAKNAQEKNGMLERQLMEIQERLHSQSMEGGKAGLSAHAIELQQQVSDLRNNLAEIIRQKEELETALTQKQLELEQRDRVMREQSKFLKVRDELLDILKGKVQQENGELSNSDENNEYLEQIAAKTEAIQELYTTLENKQLQIMRLEKMVKLMEDHQDRAQAQRTRLENRIAQLELALQRNKEQRDYIQRQTSSDEEQPYICERCRQETSVEKDKDEWSNKNDSTDNTNESLSNWLTNMSSVEITQDALNNQDLQNNNYFYDLPVTDRNRRYTYGVHNPYREFNMEDSSRESLNPYQREYHQHHYRVRSPLAHKTMPYSVAL